MTFAAARSKVVTLLGLVVISGSAIFAVGQTSCFVRQYQYSGGQYWDTRVDGSGAYVSPVGIQTNGDLFQLYAFYNGNLIELSEAVTSSINLSVAMSVSSIDVVNPNRTRSDKPYTLSYTISGLLPQAQADVSGGDTYMELSREICNNISSLGPWSTIPGPGVEYNGTVTVSEIPQTDYGMENWYFTRPANNQPGSSSYRYLNTVPAMQVFPLAKIGIALGQTSLDNYNYSGSVAGFPSPITLSCTTLYPSNRTIFLLIPPTGASAIVWDSSYNSNDSVTTSKQVDIRPYLSSSGKYTFQIWTKVPVDPSSNPAPLISSADLPGGSSNWGWEEVTQPLTFTASFSINITANVITP